MHRPHFPRNIDKILSPKDKKKGVWERKTDSEVEMVKEKLRKSSFNLTMPICIIFLSLFVCLYSMGNVQNRLLVLIVPSFLFCFTIGYQVYIGRPLASSPSFKICNKCFKEDRTGLNECPCGGLYEPPEFYNFIEGDK